jgi:hypothetical protein
LMKDLVLRLNRIAFAAAAGNFDDAAAEYHEYRTLSLAALPIVLRTAQPWSLFNPTIHDAHYGTLRQMQKLQTANKSSR